MRVGTALVVTGCLVGLLSGTSAEAQNSRSMQTRMRQMMQNVQRDIQAVQKQLKPAQEELAKAAQSLNQAQASFKQAQTELTQARKTLHERVGQSVGLPEAVAAMESAQADYDKAVDKLVVSLAGDAEFQKLKQVRTEAEENMAALKKDKSGSASAKKQRFAAASKELVQAKDAYYARLDKDPAIKPLKDKLTEADEHLKETRIKMGQESKNDSEVHSAELSFKQAKTEFEKAQNLAAIAEAKVEALQERLAADYALLGQ